MTTNQPPATGTLPAPTGRSARATSLGAWGRFAYGLLARLYLAACFAMVAWATLPAVLGWHSYTVMSGSMAPQIRAGDVVVDSPVHVADVQRGWVVTFRNPAQTDPDRPSHTLTHRVAAVRPDGQLVTRGDANQADDSTPVPADDVLGMGRLRVPMVGLPLLWLHSGQYVPLAFWAALTAGAVAVVVTDRPHRRGGPGGPGRGPRRGPRQGPPAPDSRADRARTRPWGPHRRRSSRLVLAVVLLPVLGTATGLVATGSAAAFTARSSVPAASWAAAGDLSPRYVDAVLATSPGPYEYFQLDDAAGGAALDDSGSSRNGQYAATGVTYGATGPLTDTASRAVTLDGSSGCVYSGGSATSGPTDYSVELWFRTTTTRGGKLVGWESERTSASSATYDRHVYMTNSGQLSFGVWTGSATVVTSTASYNDGSWHHMVATMRSTGSGKGMRLYVDGAQVASGTNTTSEASTGWWRVGCGNLSGWGSYPTNPSSSSFAGTVAQASVYLGALSATQVAAHYAAR